jgi:F-type H+-transporting ATPase subunit epsilon
MFKLNLLTPEKKVLVDQMVSEVTVPTQSGERQILPGHVPLIANLGTGILSYKAAGSDVLNKFVISWGYCEVNHEGVNVLAEFVQTKSEINLETAKNTISANQSKLVKEILSDEEFEVAATEIQKSQSAIQLMN